MPQGDVLLVKTSGGRPAVRRVWEARPGEVLVVHEAYYRRWQRHPHIAPQAYAFPRDQVFRHDTALLERLEALFTRSRHGDTGAAAELGEGWAQATSYTP
jgi:hypothetical protein